ncbi:hypothetical protein EVAR_89033_1 [Eumeta japonica]|uniref:Uncharacterized protein n=1 Tax=Eumeta variegata TaxID=151549 RepID=A0A4C1Z5P5_EUMVA|nr:hypothetical protein EVAR_89033_1 [Eumeta japonica]
MCGRRVRRRGLYRRRGGSVRDAGDGTNLIVSDMFLMESCLKRAFVYKMIIFMVCPHGEVNKFAFPPKLKASRKAATANVRAAGRAARDWADRSAPSGRPAGMQMHAPELNRTRARSMFSKRKRDRRVYFRSRPASPESVDAWQLEWQEGRSA